MPPKIGLVTIHDTVNYGSLLQAFSTYRAIESLGYDVELIDYKCEKIQKREAVPQLKNQRSAKDFLKYLMWAGALRKKQENVWQFIRSNMKVSRPYTKDNIQQSNKDYDVFVVGSDIVWGTDITGGDYSYFLNFAEEGKKKIAFSSSVGTIWAEQERPIVEKYLKQFQNISVREQLTVEWLRDLFDIPSENTCDPTMLWDRAFWDGYAEDSFAPKGKYVLIYAVNRDKKNITDGIRYAKEHGMPAYFVNFYTPVKGTKTIRPVTAGQWIALIKHADTVFSASYHGLLFSLYFGRNVFYYNGRGNTARAISLAKDLSIEHREGTAENLAADKPIDYDNVQRVLQSKRDKSRAALERYLMA